jgi:hypothetical protein
LSGESQLIGPCEKKFEKIKKVFKKVLTNQMVGDIIVKLSARAASLVLEN